MVWLAHDEEGKVLWTAVGEWCEELSGMMAQCFAAGGEVRTTTLEVAEEVVLAQWWLAKEVEALTEVLEEAQLEGPPDFADDTEYAMGAWRSA